MVAEHDFIIPLTMYAIAFFSNANNNITILTPYSSAHKHIAREGRENI